MPNIEADKAGIATCYLSKSQMTALLLQADKEGLTRSQIIKRSLVAFLVEQGMLEEREMDKVRIRQAELLESPSANKKQIGDLRNVKVLTEEQQAAKEKLRNDLARLREAREGKVTPEPEVQARPRRRRRMAR